MENCGPTAALVGKTIHSQQWLRKSGYQDPCPHPHTWETEEMPFTGCFRPLLPLYPSTLVSWFPPVKGEALKTEAMDQLWYKVSSLALPSLLCLSSSPLLFLSFKTSRLVSNYFPGVKTSFFCPLMVVLGRQTQLWLLGFLVEYFLFPLPEISDSASFW